MNKLKFIEQEFRDRDLDIQNWKIDKIFQEVVAASDILTKKQLIQLIDDHLNLMGLF